MQLALAVVLLVAATLTVSSVRMVQHVDLGFDPDGRITFDVLAPPQKYPKPDVGARFYRPVLEATQLEFACAGSLLRCEDDLRQRISRACF